MLGSEKWTWRVVLTLQLKAYDKTFMVQDLCLMVKTVIHSISRLSYFIRSIRMNTLQMRLKKYCDLLCLLKYQAMIGSLHTGGFNIIPECIIPSPLL